jgi:hypothetical protein
MEPVKGLVRLSVFGARQELRAWLLWLACVPILTIPFLGFFRRC